MAEISKLPTLQIPREQIVRQRPSSAPVRAGGDVLSQPGKTPQEPPSAGELFLGRSSLAPVLRGGSETVQQIRRLMTLLALSGAGEIQNTAQESLSSLFVAGEELARLLLEQAESATLFRGEPFDQLRELIAQPEAESARSALAGLLSRFECQMSLESSIRSILTHCENLLDYMFSQDRAQFGAYLDSLSDTLLTPEDALAVEARDAAAVLKGNLLPLLGEIVVKYHQSEAMRDLVMVVVHQIVRVEKGTSQALGEMAGRLARELGREGGFTQELLEALSAAAKEGGEPKNQVMDKILEALSGALNASETGSAAHRQAETLLLTLLRNESPLLGLHHFILPLLVGEHRVWAELYVDPDSEEVARGAGEQERGRKVFLAAEHERHGAIELCFWQTGERLELSLWCAEALIEPLGGIRQMVRDLALVHGFTLTGFAVEELEKAHQILQVFPKLAEKKVGIDVRI